MIEKIEELQESKNCYIIDYLPMTMLGQEYFEIEKFFLKNYIKDFSKKIVNIVVKLIGYYDAQIYLTEYYKIQSLYPIGQNIRHQSLFKIAEIISYIIENDTSSVQVIFNTSPYFLISINGGFSIAVYNTSEEQRQLLNALVTQENLFFRPCSE